MENKESTVKIHKKRVIISIIISILMVVTIALFFQTFGMLKSLIFSAIAILVFVFFGVGLGKEKELLYKIALITSVVLIAFICGYAYIKSSNILSTIDSPEKLVEVVNGFGVAGKIVFVTIQFLQVTFVPIPSTIVTGAGALLYPRFEAMFLSCCGLWIGSFLAFYLGRVFGFKIVKWILGEEVLVKYNNFIKGKDKVMLMFMFVLPVFPDDMLCMLAGLTSMSYPAFILIQLISRPINVGSTIFMVDIMELIPFRGWGIVVWSVLFICFVSLFVLLWKYSDKIEQSLLKLISKITGRPIIKNIYQVYEEKLLIEKENEKILQGAVHKTENTESIVMEEAVATELCEVEEEPKKELSQYMIFERDLGIIDKIINSQSTDFEF